MGLEIAPGGPGDGPGYHTGAMPVTALDARRSASPASARRIAVLVPAFNVSPWPVPMLERVAAGFSALGDRFDARVWLVIVDDGSRVAGTELDAHRDRLAALGCPVVRARHCLNRGQGAALQTALALARSPAVDAEFFVTMDADGQHDAGDLPRLLEPVIEQGFNIAFGNRFADGSSTASTLPRLRRAILRGAAVFERAISGLRLDDAHNGLRAFDRTTADAIELRQDRMAHATEFKQIVARRRLRYAEVPVRITYTEETLRGGQGNLNAINVLRELTRGWWLH
jgi:polyprenyl-phospho-N-acetylgalactosaminyl synthase